MVKRTLLTLLLLSSSSLGAVYQIDIVKERGVKSEKPRLVVYKVKRGDTLLKIMKRFKVPRRLLYQVVKINKLRNPNLIYAGQVIRLPVGWNEKRQRVRKKEFTEEEFKFLKTIGAKVNDDGFLFTAGKKLNLKKTPIVEASGKRFIVDLSGEIGGRTRKSLEEAGFTVIGSKELGDLIEKVLSENFSSIQRKGKLILGENDILVYKYDYMGYNKFTGQRTVINTRPDTPKTLVKLLNSYGIAVIQPPLRKLDTSEGRGKLRIIAGDGLTKINSVIKVLTGQEGVKREEGLFFPKLKLFVVYDFVSPEEKVKLELQGNKVVVLTGDFLNDIENILTLVPLANKLVDLVLYEPPSSKGKRSKFTIRGLLVSTPKEDWFLIDSVDKPQELPYLTSRGVNVMVY